MHKIELSNHKKIYFASDNHLGLPNYTTSLEREKKFVRWLESIKKDAEAIFLLGDLFDFWYEYKKVVPKGFVRVLGKLAELTDSGIKVYFFVGNHDMWMSDYFEKELAILVFKTPQNFSINGKIFHLGHGDGIGPSDKGYKFLKKIFTNKILNIMFRWIHPDIGVRLGQYLSLNNKLISGKNEVKYLGQEKEWLIQYSLLYNKKHPTDYFIFGHRHLPIIKPLSDKVTYINLGDWISHFTYVTFEGKTLSLNTFKE